MAGERGWAGRATAFGVDPDPEIPTPVMDGLRRDGFEIGSRQPAAVGSAALTGADVVVLIGCQLTDAQTNGRVITWDGVPAVSDGYEAARTAIVERLEKLLDSMA